MPSPIRHALALAAITSVIAGRSAPAGAGDARPALVLVPGDAVAVAALDLEQVRATSYWPRLRDAVLVRAGLGASLSALTGIGLDVERQVTSAVIFVPPGGDEGRSAVIAAGDFAGVDLGTLAGATRRTRHAVAYFAIEGDRGIAQVGTHLVVATLPDLEAVIDLHAGKGRGKGKTLSQRRSVRGLLNRVGTRGDAWLWIDAVRLPGGVPLPGVTELAASIDLGAGLAVAVTLVTADASAAAVMRDQMASMLARGLGTGSGVTTRGSAVDVALQIDRAVLDGLVAMLPAP